MEGNVTLVDSLGSARLALHAAFSLAFKNKEVIQMFAKRQPAALRTKLQGLSVDRKLGRVSDDAFKYVHVMLAFAVALLHRVRNVKVGICAKTCSLTNT